MNAPMTRLPLLMIVFPTLYFRYERRDMACPSMVLQQWHCDSESQQKLHAPEHCVYGEWRDVPIVQGK